MRPRSAQRKERKNLLISEFSFHARVFFSKSFLFKLLTVNARGFANPLTHNLLFDLIESSNCDVCFVQETLVSSESTIKSLSRRWLGRCFWSPASGRQGGVVTLISSKCSDEIVSWKKDSHGRIVSILIRSNGVDVNLVNVYAPTNLAERKIFFDSLHEFFIPSAAIIIGGDYNCYDNVLDKFGGNISIHKEYESLKLILLLVMFGAICIPAQGNLRGSIRPSLSGVD